MSVITPIILSAASLAYGAYSGERAATSGRRANRRQAQAQDQAMKEAAAEQRRAALAEKKAQAQQPDLGTLLADAKADALKGPGSTMLTGAGGIDQSKLTLGRGRTMLGGA